MLCRVHEHERGPELRPDRGASVCCPDTPLLAVVEERGVDVCLWPEIVGRSEIYAQIPKSSVCAAYGQLQGVKRDEVQREDG